jgi:hypothetical protein
LKTFVWACKFDPHPVTADSHRSGIASQRHIAKILPELSFSKRVFVFINVFSLARMAERGYHLLILTKNLKVAATGFAKKLEI